VSYTVASTSGRYSANRGSRHQMCLAHGSLATAAARSCGSKATRSWWRRIASLPVDRMSATVLGPALVHVEDPTFWSLPDRRFKVLQPDPHRFDGDKYGVGGET
jgi:hypothetical protein